jgi:NADPH2:quinone reductase
VNNYVTTRSELEFYCAELFDLIASGKVKILVHKVYPLADAAQAHIDLESRKSSGKLLLKLD